MNEMRAIREDRPKKFTARMPEKMPLWLEIAIGIFVGGLALSLTLAIASAIMMKAVQQHTISELRKIEEDAQRKIQQLMQGHR